MHLILTNISSTEHARIVVDTGVCSKIVSLMKSPNEDVREQSLWCLGNIVADNNDFLNHVLNIPDSINNLLLNIIYASSIRLRQNALWALNNFCYKINNLVRGFFVPAGKHDFIMKFNPKDVLFGRVISLISMLIIILTILLTYSKRKNV